MPPLARRAALLRPLALACVAAALAACGEGATLLPPQTATPTSAPSTAAPRTTPPASPTTRTPSPTPSVTPSPPPSATRTSPTASPSSAPSATGGAALPTLPPAPALSAGATVLFRGERSFSLAPGQTRTIDPADLAREESRALPACGTLEWTTSWIASAPLRSAIVLQTGRSELGLGRWGTSSLGCSSLELRNDGTAPADVRLAFTVAAL